MSKVFNSFLSTVDDFWNFILTPLRWIKNLPIRLRELAPFATLASFILAFYSFQIATTARKENAKITTQTVAMIDTMKAATKQISENLKAIPEASKSFKTGIDKMTSSIDSLKRNLDTFSLSVQDYGTVLKSVAKTTEKNVELIQKQQEMWEQELKKAPDLKLQLFRAFADTLGKIQVQAQIANMGTGIVREFTLLIECPKTYNFRSTSMFPWDSLATIQSFSRSFSQIVVPARKERRYYRFKSNELAFAIDRLPKQKLPYAFPYEIIHEKGSSADTLVIRQNDIVGYK